MSDIARTDGGDGSPERESARLRALHDLEILDTESEAAFDAVTRLASRMFSAPIALVSLVDEERQWFKSRVGVDVSESSRETSFCTHAIGEPGPLVVEDALSDARFASNPSVTGPPHIRFYMGAQLRTSSGHDLGTLCIADMEPRPAPSPEELGLLTDLAGIVTTLIEQRAALRELAAETERRRDAEQRAVDAMEETAGANQAMRGFFSRMSHDLRTPLGVILGFAEFLSEEDLTEQQKHDVTEILKAGRRMLELVNDLLQAGRIAAGDTDSTG